ncbi:hypothetical protein EIN_129830, partial [Entamoeba invadens IP1]
MTGCASFQEASLRSLVTTFAQIKKSKTIEESQSYYNTFSTVIDQVIEYITTWTGYIRFNDGEIFNHLYLLLQSFKYFILPTNKKLCQPTEESSLDTFKQKMTASYYVNTVWVLQCYVCVYSFFISDMTTKSFEISKEIFKQAVGYEAHPIESLDELKAEYTKSLFDSIRTQNIQVFLSWENEARKSLQVFDQAIRKGSVSGDMVMKQLKLQIKFRFHFLTNIHSNQFKCDNFPVNHTYRREMIFTDRLSKIQTTSVIATPVLLACIDEIKNYALLDKLSETAPTFFNYLEIALNEFDFLKGYNALLKSLSFEVNRKVYEDDINKTFDKLRGLFGKLSAVTEMNAKTNAMKMEYDLVLTSLPKINHPINSVTQLYYNLKETNDAIFTSLLMPLTDLKQLSKLVYTGTFQFRIMSRVIEMYFSKSKELDQLMLLVNELPVILKTMRTNQSDETKTEIVSKIVVISSMIDVLVGQVRYKETLDFKCMQISGNIFPLFMLKDYILKTVHLNKKLISVFYLAKVYRDLLKNYFNKLIELTHSQIVVYIYREISIQNLLQASLQYDEGDLNQEEKIQSALESLQSSIIIAFSQSVDCVELITVCAGSYSFSVIGSLLQWFFNIEKVRVYIFSLMFIVSTLCLESSLIIDTNSVVTPNLCELIEEIREVKNEVLERQQTKDNFNEFFFKASGLCGKIFEYLSWAPSKRKCDFTTPSMMRISTYIKTCVLIKKLIDSMKSGESEEKQEMLFKMICEVLNTFYSYYTLDKLFDVRKTQFPDFVSVFNQFKTTPKTEKQTFEAVTQHLLFVIFERISFEELFFELVYFGSIETREPETEKAFFELVRSYFNLQKYLSPSISDTKFSTADYVIKVIDSINESKLENKVIVFVTILANVTQFTQLAICLVAVFKDYERILKDELERSPELLTWVQTALKTIEIYSVKNANIDSLLRVIEIIVKKIFYFPKETLTLLDPLAQIIEAMEYYINKDTNFVPDVLFGALKTMILCTQNLEENKTCQIMKHRVYISSFITKARTHFSFVKWSENQKVEMCLTAFSKLDAQVNELSDYYSPDEWKKKCWDLFINIVSDVAPVKFFMEYLKTQINSLSFCLMLGIHFKKDVKMYFSTLNTILFKAEQLHEVLEVGRRVYLFSYENSQMENKAFFKIRKILKKEERFKEIKEQSNAVLDGTHLGELLDLVWKNEERQNSLLRAETAVTKEGKMVEDSKDEDDTKKMLGSGDEEDECDGDKVEGEEDEYDDDLLNGSDMVKTLNTKMHDLFMTLQSVEIDKGSKPKVRIVKLLTTIAEHFFKMADSLNYKIVMDNVVVLRDKLLEDSLCLRELLENSIELLVIIRAVLCNDKEKRKSIMEYMELYDNFGEMITKIIFDIFTFLKVFCSFNVKRSNETKQVLNRMVSGLIYFFVTPLIDIQFHDSMYVNSFIYNQSMKDHIIENSHIALLCSQFQEFSVGKEWDLMEFLDEIGDRMDEFVTYVGVKSDSIEDEFKGISSTQVSEMKVYIEDRVKLLVNNTKPSFFFLAHFGLKAVTITNDIQNLLKSKSSISLLCKRCSVKLISYLKCLNLMIDVFVMIMPKENIEMKWLVDLKEIFARRKKRVKKWFEVGSKKKFTDEFFEIMSGFESDVQYLVRTICFTYFLYSFIIDELDDIVYNISMGFNLNKKYVKDVMFVLSCFLDGYSYHNKVIVNGFQKVRQFNMALPLDLSQIPEIHAVIEELRRTIVLRSKIEKRTCGLEFGKLKSKTETLEQERQRCALLRNLLQNLQTIDFGSMTFRSDFVNELVDNDTEESILQCEKRIEEGKSTAEEINTIRNTIVNEYIHQILGLLLEQLTLIKQALSKIDAQKVMYVQYYMSVFVTQLQGVVMLIEIVRPEEKSVLEVLEKEAKTVQAQFTGENIENVTHEITKLPSLLFNVFDSLIKYDNRSVEMRNGVDKEKTQLPVVRYLLLKTQFVDCILKQDKFDDIKFGLFVDVMKYQYHRVFGDNDSIPDLKLEEMDLDIIPYIEQMSYELFMRDMVMSPPGTSFLSFNGTIFTAIWHLFYIITKVPPERVSEEISKVNSLLQLFVIGSKTEITVQIRSHLTAPIIEDLDSVFEDLYENILFENDDEIQFFPNFGKRIMFIQLIDLFNYYGIRGGLMYMHCFLRKSLVIHETIPWMLFVSTINFLKCTEKLLQISVEGITMANCIKVLEERISETVPSVFGWCLLYYKASMLIQELHRGEFNRHVIVMIEIDLMRTLITCAFKTEMSKIFCQVMDIIEVIQKNLYLIEKIQSQEEFNKFITSKLVDFQHVCAKIVSLSPQAVIYDHSRKGNRKEFGECCLKIVNEMPISSVLKSVIEDNKNGEYDFIMLSVCLNPIDCFRTNYARFNVLANELHLLFDKLTGNEDTKFAMKFHGATLQLSDSFQMMKNAINIFCDIIPNAVLIDKRNEITEKMDKVTLDDISIAQITASLETIHTTKKELYSLYTFFMFLLLTKTVQSNTFDCANGRQEMTKNMKMLYPLIVIVEQIIEKDKLSEVYSVSKQYEELYCLVKSGKTYKTERKRIEELLRRINFVISYVMEYLKIFESVLFLSTDLIEDGKHTEEAVMYIKQIFEIRKDQLSVLAQERMINPFIRTDLFVWMVNTQLPKLNDKSQIKEVSQYVRKFALEQIFGDVRFGFSYCDMCKASLLEVDRLCEKKKCSKMLKMIGYIHSIEQTEYMSFFYRNSLNVESWEWMNCFMTAGTFKAFLNLLQQDTVEIGFVNEDEEKKDVLKTRFVYIMRNAVCMGFQNLRIAAELTDCSLKGHSMKCVSSSTDNVVVTLLTAKELQKVYSFFSTFRTNEDQVVESDNNIVCSANFYQRTLRHLKNMLLQMGDPKEQFYVRAFITIRALIEIARDEEFLYVKVMYSRLISLYTLLEKMVDSNMYETVWKKMFDILYIYNGNVMTDISLIDIDEFKKKVDELLEYFENVFVQNFKNHSPYFFTNETLSLLGTLFCCLMDNTINDIQIKTLQQMCSCAFHIFALVKNDPVWEKCSKEIKADPIDQDKVIEIADKMFNAVINICENRDSLVLILESLTTLWDS